MAPRKRRIVITDERVSIRSDDDVRGTCREVSEALMVWAITHLTEQLAISLAYRRSGPNYDVSLLAGETSVME